MSTENVPTDFPTTAWTFIQSGKSLPPEDYVGALNAFIARYWRPVFAYMRRAGRQVEDAADLTQEFLIRLVERDLVHKADSSRGRFRAFLLWHARMFLADQAGDRQPRQRDFERQLIPVSSLLKEDRSREPATDATPEDVFNQTWAFHMVQRVVDRLERFYQGERRTAWFAIFVAVHFSSDPDDAPTQEALAQRFTLSRDQVRYVLEKAEERFRHFTREEVRQEVGADADVADEVRELMSLIGSS